MKIRRQDFDENHFNLYIYKYALQSDAGKSCFRKINRDIMLIEEFMKGTRVCELARKHSLSYERVRQIIYSALKYNKKLVDNGRAKHVSIELLQDYKFIGEEIIKK